MEAGLEFSYLSRYFIRALARQEMMMALIHRRRNLIPTSVWLDQERRPFVDRFMGITVTLMPLLEELCALAEDLRKLAANDCSLMLEGSVSSQSGHVDCATRSTLSLTLPESNGYLDRAATLRDRIESWHPMGTQTALDRSHQKFAHQGNAYRSAALLYLHRLFHPAGCSVEADQVAFDMASEIVRYLQAPPEEIRTSLWPAFMAAAELETREDRRTVLHGFEAIYDSRNTTTTLRTKAFIVGRVWKARDVGRNWDWMALVDRYPHECIPL